MYKAHYINPLRQYGSQTYDLLLEDEDGILPPLRINKSFNSGVTETELADAAEAEVILANTQYNLRLQETEPESVEIDKPR